MAERVSPNNAPDAEPARAGGGIPLRGRSAQPAPAETQPDAELPPPAFDKDQMLGEFRLLRRLGRGGMAEVYLAEQTSLKRNVAVKVLRSELVTDATFLGRFKTEALAAAGLNHPNIVQVYTVGEAGGVHYIAQEYVQGMNLREFLVRKGPPDLNVALVLMKQAASALQAAHTAGIVHRDIKPENIMLTRKGEVKVADFGLAKFSQPGEPLNLTQVGTTMGTPLYMSPEQVNGHKLDQRSDIYSFGVSCYHLLSGSPPFRGETALSVAVQHLREQARPLEELRPDLPPPLCRIVHKMMAKELDQRYPNAAAVLKDLKRIAPEGRKTPAPASENELPIAAAAEPVGTGPAWAQGILRYVDRPLLKQVPLFLVGFLLFGGVAAGAGWLLRVRDPLAMPVAGKETTVEKQGTAAEQYFHASALVSDERAWKAVIDYFPSDTVYRPLAQVELGLMYLRDNRPAEAAKLFDDLARYSDVEPQWQAAGLAGQMIMASVNDETDRSLAVLERLLPMQKHLTPRLRALVQDAVQRNREKLRQKSEKDWQKLFETKEDELREPPRSNE